MNDKNEVRLCVNGLEYKCKDSSEAYSIALQTLIPRIKYTSADTIKTWLVELWKMVYDKEEGIGSRMTASSKSYLKQLSEINTVEALQVHMYDLLLRKEKLNA